MTGPMNDPMADLFVFRTSPDQQSALALHPETADSLGLDGRKVASLCFGNQKQYVSIVRNPEIAPPDLLLSENLIQQLHLPDYLRYEVSVSQNTITLGPCIGLLLSREDRLLKPARLKKMLLYGKEYAKLHGAIILFALDKVDQANRLIEGYCYHPAKEDWQRGTFPYPAAIYRTIGLNAAWKNHFLAANGDTLFNSRYFGKWEMYQWFAADPDIGPHLPHTILYQAPGDVLEMLQRYTLVYVKPVLGLRGRGIVRISAENGVWVFRWRDNRQNRRVVFAERDAVAEYIGRRFRPGKCLMQRAVPLLEYEGRVIDFRCVLQKDQSGAWVCRAVIGRCGARGSVVSNISSGGTAYPAAHLLRLALAASDEAIAQWLAKITAFAVTVCHKLDEFGIRCGTLGLDIGIDKQGHLWLIEINNRDPDPGIALDIRDPQLYRTLKTSPLYYAKFLAGFPERR